MSSTLSLFASYPLQAGKWQFLFFKGTFDVRLNVMEHLQDRTVVFTLAESTFMQNFEGRWQVRQASGDAPVSDAVRRDLRPQPFGVAAQQAGTIVFLHCCCHFRTTPQTQAYRSLNIENLQLLAALGAVR
jgi:hypothetical protein